MYTGKHSSYEYHLKICMDFMRLFFLNEKDKKKYKRKNNI